MIINARHPDDKQPVTRAGSMLIEMTVALGLLTAIGVILLKGSIDVMAPRNWIVVQNMADSYLTYEEAYARRVSFDEFTDDANSDWAIFDPEAPEAPTNEIGVDIGKLPTIPNSDKDPIQIRGKLTRIRIAVSTNIPTASNTEYAVKLWKNPAKMETWKLQSILTYTIGGKDYVKTRTVVRTQ